eukprot:TRINITY_DN32486_c0_g1_i1.p1 TRINITY_DN32486_c0_g1~~TRINITY_DN32486_c0_g1_i1.p1  ORF type:complete len:421 (-),score=92.55 TRINITY_DN32486_c0_g1_i1:286-1548(-)
MAVSCFSCFSCLGDKSSGNADGSSQRRRQLGKQPSERGPLRGSTNGNGSSLHQEDLDDAIEETAKGIIEWSEVNKPGGFVFVETVAPATRNHGRVDLMQRRGKQVAVKRMPNQWMRDSYADFRQMYPKASERPWYDMAFTKLLNELRCPYAVDLLGVYRDVDHTYMVMSYASGGDLFMWSDSLPAPGATRESMIKPVLMQVCEALCWLHNHGIAHRDMSLENVLLTPGPDGETSVKVIDFAMATLKRECTQIRGKNSYQAPEMHLDASYDAFLVDAFAVGIVAYGTAVKDYPWLATIREECQLFEYVTVFGFERLLERRRLKTGERIIDVLSPELVDFLCGLLELLPSSRTTFGENCWESEQAADGKRRASVWQTPWFAPGESGGSTPVRKKSSKRIGLSILNGDPLKKLASNGKLNKIR